MGYLWLLQAIPLNYMAMSHNPGTIREPQNSWDLWMFIRLKIDTNRFWPIPTWLLIIWYIHLGGYYNGYYLWLLFIMVTHGFFSNHPIITALQHGPPGLAGRKSEISQYLPGRFWSKKNNNKKGENDGTSGKKHDLTIIRPWFDD